MDTLPTLNRDAFDKMMQAGHLKSYNASLDERYGPAGTAERDELEDELRLDLLAVRIKQLREEQNLTQEALGKLVGVGKSQISRLENSPSNVKFSTVIRVFKALKRKIIFRVEPELSDSAELA